MDDWPPTPGSAPLWPSVWRAARWKLALESAPSRGAARLKVDPGSLPVLCAVLPAHKGPRDSRRSNIWTKSRCRIAFLK
jgi:hypothetical protein